MSRLAIVSNIQVALINETHVIIFYHFVFFFTINNLSMWWYIRFFISPSSPVNNQRTTRLVNIRKAHTLSEISIHFVNRIFRHDTIIRVQLPGRIARGLWSTSRRSWMEYPKFQISLYGIQCSCAWTQWMSRKLLCIVKRRASSGSGNSLLESLVKIFEKYIGSK